MRIVLLTIVGLSVVMGAPVTPMLSGQATCAIDSNASADAALCIAYFGYTSSAAVTLPVSVSENRFFPAPNDRSQPTTFVSGAVGSAFSVIWPCQAEPLLAWLVTNESAIATTSHFTWCGSVCGGCRNGGVCVPTAGGGQDRCACRPGFTGDGCQTAPLPGLDASWWSNAEFDGVPVLTEVLNTINEYWATSGARPELPLERFSGRFLGALYINRTAEYRFEVGSDDGMRLYVGSDHAPIASFWGPRSFRRTLGPWVQLNAGEYYHFRCDYYQDVGAAGMQLRWSIRDSPLATPSNLAVVPASAFFRITMPLVVLSSVTIELLPKSQYGNFSVSLNQPPLGDVLVLLENGGSQFLRLSNCSLPFDATNWNVPQEVKVVPLTEDFGLNQQASINVNVATASAAWPFNFYAPTILAVDCAVNDPSCLLPGEHVNVTLSKGAPFFCSSAGDPHVNTYHQHVHHFMGIGDYYLTRDPSGVLAVQVRQKPCGGAGASCNTAVAVKYGDSVVSVVLNPYNNVPIVRVRSDSLLAGFAIFSEGGGRTFRLELPNGATIEIQADHWRADGSSFLTVGVHMPQSSHGCLYGLCGSPDCCKSFKGFAGRDGILYQDNQVNTFGDSWQVPANENLFSWPDNQAIIGNIAGLPCQQPPSHCALFPCATNFTGTDEDIADDVAMFCLEHPTACNFNDTLPSGPLPSSTPCDPILYSNAVDICRAFFNTSTFAIECGASGVDTHTWFETCVDDACLASSLEFIISFASAFDDLCTTTGVPPNCPHQCSMNGVCVSGTCVCTPPFGDYDCSQNTTAHMPTCTEVFPEPFGDIRVGGTVKYIGRDFYSHLSFTCDFGYINVAALVISEWIVLCPVPPVPFGQLPFEVRLFADGAELSSCEARTFNVVGCGDGVVAPPFEKCDDGFPPDTQRCTSECQCQAGWYGPLCATNPNDCPAVNPCQNGATCVDGLDKFHCACPPGWYGHLCEVEQDPCASYPCLHGGTCVVSGTSFVCICPPLHTGELCDTCEQGVCLSNPCQNGGFCDETVNGWRCTCSPGYTGVACETEINECESSPCVNGASCVDHVASFSCTCTCGYEGLTCATNTNECATFPCANAGTCTDRVCGFSCACWAGFTGSMCETNVDECASSPCTNGGTCSDSVNHFACICPPDFTGVLCESNIDQCASSPCANGATCANVATAAGYTCNCVAGTTGVDCESHVNECASSPCHNGGTCSDGVSSFVCACPCGWVGARCASPLNECASTPCQNGATCIDGVCGYTCQCVHGFFGGDCETDIDECASSPCENGATCEAAIGGFSCTCACGYAGATCANDVNECASAPCHNGGTCVDGVCTFTCVCIDGYTGSECESDIEECHSSPCDNGGTCTTTAGAPNTYMCECPFPFTGAQCETDNDKCLSTPCQNGATCLRLPGAAVGLDGSYACLCAQGYTGLECETDIDECASTPCANGATCNDFVASYSCECACGWSGLHCDASIDECASTPCVNGGTCIDVLCDFSCVCPSGYFGKDCSGDVDECASNPCRNGATCNAGVDVFTCECACGWTGTLCSVPMDECVSTPCINGGTCIDAQCDFACVCPSGYFGKDCSGDVDECASSPCDNGATCNAGVNVFTCDCLCGYEGPTCAVDTNECASSPCAHGGTCNDNACGYACSCAPGYTGVYCESDIDECASSPCHHDGTCSMAGTSPSSFECVCAAGYTGVACETDVNECESSPCANGGTCAENAISSIVCQCASGFVGDHCETDVNECVSNPCQNGGTCLSDVDSFSCVCVCGYEGPTCVTETNECASNPCLNGAACVDLVCGYQCTCLPGFTGLNCESNVEECASLPCQNGATCVDAINTFSCACDCGWSGTLCDMAIDECASNACLNGAICVDTVCGYSCQCAPGYFGAHCETDVDECASMPCEHGGFCSVHAINGFSCTCPPGYTGVACETDVDECLSSPCENGGTCTSASGGSGTFVCDCAVSHTGARCESSVDPCASSPCHGDATCSSLNTLFSFTCGCPCMFTGTVCDIPLAVDACASSPCAFGSTCVASGCGFECQCAVGQGGALCSDAACLVTSVTQVAVSMAGGTGEVDVLLTGPVGGDVLVNIVNNLPQAIRVSHCSLRFNASNWHTAQRVSVYATGQTSGVFNSSLDFAVDSTASAAPYHSLINADCDCFAARVYISGTSQPMLQCRSSGDPHFTTWDGARYDFQGSGIHYMVRSPDGLLAIQVAHVACGQSGAAACNQAVAVRHGSAVIVVSLVGSQPSVVIHGDTAANGLALVNESSDRFKISLPNGGRVAGKIRYNIPSDFYYINLDARMPRSLAGCLYGLCGTADGNSANEYTDALGVVHPQNDTSGLASFATSWSVVQNSSEDLFLGTSALLPVLPSLTCSTANAPTFQSYVCPVGGVEPFDEGDVTPQQLILCEQVPSACPSGIAPVTPLTPNVTLSECDAASKIIDQIVSGCRALMYESSLAQECIALGLVTQPYYDSCLTDGCLSGGLTFSVASAGDMQEDCEDLMAQPAQDQTALNAADPCSSSPCASGGTCHDCPLSGFHCECLPGFELPTCSPIDFCASSPCHFGTCVLHPGVGFSCACIADYTGTLCESEIDECHSTPCANGGTCFDGDGVAGHTCACPAGFTGTECESDVDECESSPCVRGTCVDEPANAYQCACPSGTTGVACESDIDECASSPCINGATCDTIRPGTHFCICLPGYTGLACESVIDECASSPCQNGGTCGDGVDKFVCVCAAGYTGETCETDVDECASFPCVSTGGTCVDLVDGYRCECAPGYTGNLCESDVDECLSSPCLNGASCFNTVGDFICDCVDGYLGVVCNSTMDTCLSSPCSALGSVKCSTLHDHTVCQCEAGYTGVACETDIDECASSPCGPGATCLDGTGTGVYTCDCPTGLMGALCESNVDECVSQPCTNGGTCIDQLDGFACVCPCDYHGTTCDTFAPSCASSPCLNGGVCSLSGACSHTCTCVTGFTGVSCETDIAECASAPCVNGATCVEGASATHSCVCAPGFSGEMCESDVNECESSPCGVNGACTNMAGTFQCTCDLLFTGTTCESPFDPCTSSPCANGGSCSLTGGSVMQCACAPSYTGPDCHSYVDSCASSPCYGTATCIESGMGTFMCACPTDRTGPQCETGVLPPLECLLQCPDQCSGQGECVHDQVANTCGCQCNATYQLPACTHVVVPRVDFMGTTSGRVPFPIVYFFGHGFIRETWGSFSCRFFSWVGAQPGEFHDVPAVVLNQFQAFCFVPPTNAIIPWGPVSVSLHSSVGGIASRRRVTSRENLLTFDHVGCGDGQLLPWEHCDSQPNCSPHTCFCLPGYESPPSASSSQLCSVDPVDECLSSPCRNGASCTSSGLVYTCACADNFAGSDCAECAPGFYPPGVCNVDPDECVSDPCENGGTCTSQGLNMACACTNTFTGTMCETEVSGSPSGLGVEPTVILPAIVAVGVVSCVVLLAIFAVKKHNRAALEKQRVADLMTANAAMAVDEATMLNQSSGSSSSFLGSEEDDEWAGTFSTTYESPWAFTAV